VFDNFAVAMIKAGEASGQLDMVLEQLADVQETAAQLKRKVRSAMTYPIAIGALAGLIVTGMLLFLVPRFEEIFSNLGGTLPLPTRIIIKLSNIFTSSMPIIIVGTFGFVFGLRQWIKRPTGRLAFDAFKLKIPLFGDLIRKAAVARFARSLGVLVRSGAPILEALAISSRTVRNQLLTNAVEDVSSLVRDGSTIAKAMQEHKSVFPSMVIHMIEAGEESGQLDALLDKVSDYYEKQVEATVDALTSLIEPMLLVFMGVVVGGMVVSLYLPMFKVISLVQ
jgi:type IV pilus assembly protein PilC